MRARATWLILLFVTGTIVPSTVGAQPRPPKPFPQDTKQELPFVTLKLRSSRTPVAAAEAWTVFGTVENKSPQTIYIVNRFTTLTLPLEIVGQASLYRATLTAAFPTTEAEPGKAFYYRVIAVLPKHSYSFVWDVNKPDFLKAGRDPKCPCDVASPGATDPKKNAATPSQAGVNPVASPGTTVPGSVKRGPFYETLEEIGKFIFFQPGRYEVSSVVHYWLENPKPYLDSTIGAPGPSQPANLEGTAVSVATLEVEVRASPLVILLGAIIGGVFAYLLIWFTKRDERDSPTGLLPAIKRLPGRLAALAAAAILAGTVAVFLQRVGNAVLFITISVNDFWGSIALGFAAEWIGLQALEGWLRRPGEKKTKSNGQPPVSPETRQTPTGSSAGADTPPPGPSPSESRVSEGAARDFGT